MTIVVPHGNATEKNAAMRAFGAALIEHGRDFDEAKEVAQRIAAERGLTFAPSFHRDFVVGVATYALELFGAVDGIDTAKPNRPWPEWRPSSTRHFLVFPPRPHYSSCRRRVGKGAERRAHAMRRVGFASAQPTLQDGTETGT